MLLTTKIQYWNCEPGEFISESKHSFEEVTHLIEVFPWDEQHVAGLQIQLTNPSITVQDDNSYYLKLSLYYNNKFVLYFFNGKNLYKKSFIKYQEAFPFIQYFFENRDIEYPKFKKEITWGIKLKKHFESNDFVYTVDHDNPFHYADFFTKEVLILAACINLFLLPKLLVKWDLIIACMLFIESFLLAGFNLILLFNYYFSFKGMSLKLSKANPVFFFGIRDTEQEYNKADIEEIVIEQNTGRRCPWGEYCLSIITFKNGSYIVVPSIFVNATTMRFKMTGIPLRIQKTLLPYYRKGQLTDL